MSRFWVLQMRSHMTEQFHISGSRLVPAEILFHIPLLQRLEGFPVIVVKIHTPLQRHPEIVRIVALEGEAKTALTLIVHTGHGIFQTTGCVHHRHSTVAHCIHLT